MRNGKGLPLFGRRPLKNRFPVAVSPTLKPLFKVDFPYFTRLEGCSALSEDFSGFEDKKYFFPWGGFLIASLLETVL